MITEYGIEAKSNSEIISELGGRFKEYRLFSNLTQKETWKIMWWKVYRHHELSILGKRNNITRKDLLLFAQRQDIKNAANIIDEVANAVAHFEQYAEKAGISEYWTKKIEKVLKENEI